MKADWRAGPVGLLILGLALLLPPVGAQSQPEKTARVGVLVPGPAAPESDTHSAFRQVLGERGWIEGRNLILDFRYADNRYDRLGAVGVLKVVADIPFEGVGYRFSLFENPYARPAAALPPEIGGRWPRYNSSGRVA